MNRSPLNYLAALLIPIALVLIGVRLTSGASRSQVAPVATPVTGAELAAAPAEDTAVFAGGPSKYAANIAALRG